MLVSPIMEACPTENKEKAMSLLHSFYCWGHMAVVLFSTLFFTAFGISNWRILAIIWALIPIVNAIFLHRCLYILCRRKGKRINAKGTLPQQGFWLMMIMMVCSGASEQAVSQWASTFAEQGLGVSKTVGDLAGPLAFAAFMGTSRLLYGKFGDKLNLNKCMFFQHVFALFHIYVLR